MSWDDYEWKPSLQLDRDEMKAVYEALDYQLIMTENNRNYQIMERIAQTLGRLWDPEHDQNALCAQCDDRYHRHFDSYDNMAPVGCKYCECDTFVEPT